MALSIIGAGFGRTGTDSMRFALNHLGFGPCHHMHEVLDNAEQRRLWRAKANGACIDWEQLFEGYSSCVDWPSVFYWRELAEAYPDAKVLLTSRSTESWLESMKKTIFRVLRDKRESDSVGSKVIAAGTFDWRLDDDDYVVSVFERHMAEVQNTIPSERILVYQLGDGWQPLCEFLNVSVPDEPFPRTNSASEFNSRG